MDKIFGELCLLRSLHANVTPTHYLQQSYLNLKCEQLFALGVRTKKFFLKLPNSSNCSINIIYTYLETEFFQYTKTKCRILCKDFLFYKMFFKKIYVLVRLEFSFIHLLIIEQSPDGSIHSFNLQGFSFWKNKTKNALEWNH